jgi:alkanesulfonate monooxygenase SsuD/methylene tetrahydromethanopterin reductase-like flavin-dependent oxidoreductase (luciferase family)
MKFAHFAHVWGKPGMTPAQRYKQLWKELQVCDELGFEYGFCVEHHFRPDESWMSAPNMYAVAAGARTKRIRLGGMGHIVPLHEPVRLAEEIALADQMLDGRLEVGLVPGIAPANFPPFGAAYPTRREETLEFVGFLKTAYTENEAFDFDGKFHKYKDVTLSVGPVQRPHPPLWIETRDPPTLEFCAKHGINTGYFLVFPREDAAPRYRVFLEQWKAAGWTTKPNIAYSTVVYVDKTDAAAREKAHVRAGQAYAGFFPPAPTEEKRRELQLVSAELFRQRGEPGAAEVMSNLLDPDYLEANDLVIIGSPDTVAQKLKDYATDGVFNTFFGEFNFSDLPEEDLLRSIRLFGEQVIPALRDYEPF